MLAQDRLEALPGGDLRLKLKSRSADGTTRLRLSPMELLERLAALVPTPRTNLTLYHGVFAANAKGRARLVPTRPDERQRTCAAKPERARPNHGWAELVRRGLDIDSLECPARCRTGRLRFLATIEAPRVIRRILEHLDLPSEPVRPTPARAPPEQEHLDWGA